jgi:ATP-binding cassette subfamily B protein
LIIAHRLSTITHADQILVMEQGQIIERGTHAQLLEAQGRYAEMWQMQERTAVD